MNPGLKITEDGSNTLYVKELNEHYHSTFGAITESQHIFINNGLKQIQQDTAEILEIGFGTGLNTFLTLAYAVEADKTIRYTAIEPFPLGEAIYSQLNYSNFEISEKVKDKFIFLHSCQWDSTEKITSKFSLTKIKIKLQEFILDKQQFDIIYFDAFSPEVQPELWTEEIFRKLYKASKPGGILVTYSCKGRIKRLLKGVGFRVDKIPGPPGKREFIKATKTNK